MGHGLFTPPRRLWYISWGCLPLWDEGGQVDFWVLGFGERVGFAFGLWVSNAKETPEGLVTLTRMPDLFSSKFGRCSTNDEVC